MGFEKPWANGMKAKRRVPKEKKRPDDKTSQTRRAVFQPTTYRRMQKGVDQMVNAIRPTLGPLPRIVAGGNAMRLRHYLENGMRVILDELPGMAVHLEGKKRLAQIAESICYNTPLSKTVGEILLKTAYLLL